MPPSHPTSVSCSSVTNDGKTLLVTNFASSTLELVDLARLPAR